MCDVSTVGKISDCQRPWTGTLSRLVWSLDLLSGDLKEPTHSSIRLGYMPVLWPVISSLHDPRSHMGRIAAARGALYMLSVLPREQQVAEKPNGEHQYTSSSSPSSASSSILLVNGRTATIFDTTTILRTPVKNLIVPKSRTRSPIQMSLLIVKRWRDGVHVLFS